MVGSKASNSAAVLARRNFSASTSEWQFPTFAEFTKWVLADSRSRDELEYAGFLFPIAQVNRDTVAATSDTVAVESNAFLKNPLCA